MVPGHPNIPPANPFFGTTKTKMDRDNRRDWRLVGSDGRAGGWTGGWAEGRASGRGADTGTGSTVGTEGPVVYDTKGRKWIMGCDYERSTVGLTFCIIFILPFSILPIIIEQ